MPKWLLIDWLHLARQSVCFVICALFVFPATVVQPVLAYANTPLPEEREESNKEKDASNDSTIKDSINQINRRALPQRSPIARSVNTDSSHLRTSACILAHELKDVFQNGLGTRLRC